ncbi:MAG: DNA/pantothenate metabolism flavoprotein, partial [Candidatus Aenigmarchaeota archaeon]|nr:DNA/pantothenate metabolism flavoprotein [Candidatus Aenigmarchaeota archaeon]
HLEVDVPSYIKVVKAEDAREMGRSVLREKADAYVLAAAVGDFEVGKRKGKADSRKSLFIKLKPMPKIVDMVRRRFPHAKLVIFKAEVEGKLLEKAARRRMKETAAVLGVANRVGRGRGFGDGRHKVMLLGKKWRKLVRGKKSKIADSILNELF